ncbi:Transcriptional regulatory protein BtsR [Sulfitobacter sp. DSM 110093]|uniref:response regulator n=1 Tax=Sulfitobacter sp. DSM 110093 TaxID=2883127 RepID=UPI001FAD9849|nr:response regulator [Sulfitobacter sp. DSM 110093]UOA30790.1 Transcriptional regulatory protein BtsR [Sulfitobacter sp. DSM 110093]
MASRILHIDDDPIILELVKMIFSDDRSLTFVSCLNARDALAVVDDLKPDLIISDISMPDMGGMELVHRFGQNPAIAGTPIIFLSGRTRDLEVYDAFRDLEATVMQKPVDPGQLRSTVRHLLASQQQPMTQASNQ